MSCFPTSEAAFAQEMLLSAVSARVSVISFLLENILLLENGLYSKQFTYLTAIVTILAHPQV